MQQSLRKVSRCLGFIISLAPALPAHAEAVFPNEIIRFVAPNSASTPPDIISRIIAKQLTEDEHWRVIVENRPGGITTIAANDVLTQPSDGHSLFGMSVPSVAAPALVQGISYAFERDFDPVIKASVSYNVLVVNPSVPATSVAELVALLEESARQVDLFIRRIWHTGPPDRRTIQTADRHARPACTLRAIPAGYRRPSQWHELVHVCDDVAGGRSDQDGEAPCTCRDGCKARVGSPRRPDHRRSRLRISGGGRLGGFCSETRSIEGNHRAAKCGHQQSVAKDRRARGICQAWRRAGRRLA